MFTYGGDITSDVEVMPDGDTCIVADQGGWLRQFSLKTGKLLDALTAHDAWVNRIDISPDGKRLVTGADDQLAKIWDASSLELFVAIHRGGQVAAAGYSPDGKTLALGGSALSFFPVLRDLAREDGGELYARAVKETGRRLSGFELEPVGSEREESDKQGKAPAPVAPNQLRGKVTAFVSFMATVRSASARISLTSSSVGPGSLGSRAVTTSSVAT